MPYLSNIIDSQGNLWIRLSDNPASAKADLKREHSFNNAGLVHWWEIQLIKCSIQW